MFQLQRGFSPTERTKVRGTEADKHEGRLG